MTLLEFYNILLEVGIHVGHYEVDIKRSPPYIVYSELNTNYDYASGRPRIEKIRIEVLHISKDEFDPSLANLKNLLHKHKISFDIATEFHYERKNIINSFELTIQSEILL